MKFTKHLTAAVTLAAVTALGSAAHADDKQLIRMAHSAAESVGTDQHMFAWTFANYVNTYSETIEVKVFANSSLGQSRDVIEAMQLGSGASGTVGGVGEYASFAQKLGVTGLPFLWKSYDHVHDVVDGEVGDALEAEMEAIGFKVLAWGDSWGYRNVTTAEKEVGSVEDLAGLKIRTIPNEVFVGAGNAMGANATPMSFGEVYTSLESGVLDGFEHTASTVITNKFNEVACCVALTRHLFDPTFMTMSMSEWNKFDADEQAFIMEAAGIASDVVRALAPVREAEALETLKTLGMKVTDIDVAPMVANAASVQEELAAGLGASDLLTQIRAQ